MIEMKIIKRFDNQSIFTDLCVDYNGKVDDSKNTITFPDHLSFNKVINLLVPVFLPPHTYKLRQYLDFKEIKHEDID